LKEGFDVDFEVGTNVGAERNRMKNIRILARLARKQRMKRGNNQ
jgi:hypothetical protein